MSTWQENGLSLASRNENTRDVYTSSVVRFELDEILRHFCENIEAINKQNEVADYLIANQKNREAEDVMRS